MLNSRTLINYQIMVWTKLLRIKNPREAFKPRKVNGIWQAPEIRGKYKAVLRRKFLKYGVDWNLTTWRSWENSPRHKRPKPSKIARKKPLRLAEVKDMVEKSDEMILEYRKQRLNERKYGGLDKFFHEYIPDWIKNQKNIRK